jgi:hypothetical protein
MQTILMEQARWIYHHWAVVSFAGGGLWAILRKIRNLNTMLVTAAGVPEQLQTHTNEDKTFQTKAMNLIQAEGAATRREIHEALVDHVAAYHRS